MTFPTDKQIETAARAARNYEWGDSGPVFEDIEVRDYFTGLARAALTALAPEWREMERAVERYQCLEIGIQQFLDGKCIADTHRYFTNYMASYRIEYGHDAARELEG